MYQRILESSWTLCTLTLLRKLLCYVCTRKRGERDRKEVIHELSGCFSGSIESRITLTSLIVKVFSCTDFCSNSTRATGESVEHPRERPKLRDDETGGSSLTWSEFQLRGIFIFGLHSWGDSGHACKSRASAVRRTEEKGLEMLLVSWPQLPWSYYSSEAL